MIEFRLCECGCGKGKYATKRFKYYNQACKQREWRKKVEKENEK